VATETFSGTKTSEQPPSEVRVLLTRELDADVLKRGQQLVRYAQGSFRELLTPLDVADFHARRTTISSRLAQLDRFAGRIASDPEANPATGTFRDVVSAIEEGRIFGTMCLRATRSRAC